MAPTITGWPALVAGLETGRWALPIAYVVLTALALVGLLVRSATWRHLLEGFFPN